MASPCINAKQFSTNAGSEDQNKVCPDYLGTLQNKWMSCSDSVRLARRGLSVESLKIAKFT